eukprot:7289709-Pyramimonas_sp.AAC.1
MTWSASASGVPWRRCEPSRNRARGSRAARRWWAALTINANAYSRFEGLLNYDSVMRCDLIAAQETHLSAERCEEVADKLARQEWRAITAPAVGPP